MGRHIKVSEEVLKDTVSDFLSHHIHRSRARFNESYSDMENTQELFNRWLKGRYMANTRSYTVYTENLSRIPFYLLGGRQNIATEGLMNSTRYSTYGRASGRLRTNRSNYVSVDTYQRDESEKLDTYVRLSIDNRRDLHKINSISPVILNPNLVNKPADQLEKVFSDLLDASLRLPNRFDRLLSLRAGAARYQDLFGWFKSKNSSRGEYFQFRDFGLEANHFSLVDHNNRKVIAMLTLNPDYVDYYLLKLTTGAKKSEDTLDINKSIFTITLDKDFDKEDSIYSKELVRLIRKGMVDVLSDVKVERINGNSFYNEVFADGIKGGEPELNAIESVDYNDDLQRNMLESLTAQKTLEDKQIVIIH